MKTFKDLKFTPHTTGQGLHGLAFFPNGYGVSVVRFKLDSRFASSFRNGYGSYTENESEWELAVITGSEEDYEICYKTTITDDVIGYQSEEEVTEIMKKVQAL